MMFAEVLVVHGDPPLESRLADFRMRGPSGRRHEWLSDIRTSDVEEIVRAALIEAAFVPAFEPRGDAHVIAAKVLKDHHQTAATLIALIIKNLPDEVRARVMDAVCKRTGKVELRTRVEPRGFADSSKSA